MSLSRFVILSASIHLILLVGIGHYYTNTPRLEQKDSIKWLIDVNLIMLEEYPDDNPVLPGKILPPQGHIVSLTPPKIEERFKEETPITSSDGEDTATDPPSLEGEDQNERIKEAPDPMTAILQEKAQKQIEDMRQSFMNKVNAQFLLIKTKHFFKTTRTVLRGMLETVLSPDGLKEIEGGRGMVVITYTDEGDLASLTIEGEGFRKILEEKVEWSKIPLPKNFSLPYKRLTLNISIEDSRIKIVIVPD